MSDALLSNAIREFGWLMGDDNVPQWLLDEMPEILLAGRPTAELKQKANRWLYERYLISRGYLNSGVPGEPLQETIRLINERTEEILDLFKAYDLVSEDVTLESIVETSCMACVDCDTGVPHFSCATV
ncbi:MAG: hypothetical protein P4L61_03940 [Candidatus Pacebacteria bacterium]|nr:hypothetical protein [Candidatus Paceibacterota bacterium]